jgi:hypothetical protein
MVGVFLSHSSKDKGFARRLGNDLRGQGARVWIDEAEIGIGESLIDKISEGIHSTDYLVVLLSPTSTASEWVKRELNIALTHEIKGKRLKVLPCLLKNCSIPPFLLDKKYADFRREKNYVEARSQLMDALGLGDQRAEERFLDQHVFYDLLNLDDGFDSPSIKYFGKDDFAKVLDRLEIFGIGVYGIEPWPNGEFGDVSIFGDYGDDPADPGWYRKAYSDFPERGLESHFSATYAIPEAILKRFVTS